ncbi:MAG TPA: hypothetical protein ENJ56_05870, partial [Anaerolineae bacterium]|nr:hypothetical protein [Anaerolineae bacterium]
MANSEEEDQLIMDNSELIIENERVSDEAIVLAMTSPITDDAALTIDNSPATIQNSRALTDFIRTDNDDPAITYNGSFSTLFITNRYGDYPDRSNTLGDSISFTFTGPWVNVGLVGHSTGGNAEIFIDGVSQGIVDTYRSQTRDLDFIFDGLVNASHTISVSVLATSNPLATNSYVNFDFIDVWNGTPLPQGAFEEDSDPFLYTSNFTNRNDADASAGHFRRGADATGWFVFSGTGVDLDVFRYNQAGATDFYLDGDFQFSVDLYNPSDITETITFDGLADTLHLLTVRAGQNYATLDHAVTPASGTAYTPPTRVGITRYEEFDSSILYTGQPFSATTSTWDYQTSFEASRGDVAVTTEASDTISFTFDGDWVGVGFIGRSNAGQVIISVDGTSQGTFDLYRRAITPVNLYFDGFGAGTHTVLVTNAGTTNPFSSNDSVYFDFYESWDGSAEPTGVFEADLSDLDRFQHSDSWSLVNDPDASSGSYLRASASNRSTWFNFTGTSVTYEAFAFSSGGNVDIYLDGQYQTRLNLYNATDISRTISFDGLANAPHVLQIQQLNNYATVDRIHVPAITAGFTPSTCSGYCRYGELDPALRYNGVPFTATATSWQNQAFNGGSAGFANRATAIGDSVSFDFNTEWVNIGLIGDFNTGDVDIYIDGVLQETVDTYRASDKIIERSYSVAAGAHTISATVKGTAHANSSNSYLIIDHFDTWDGTGLGDGKFEETDSRVLISSKFDLKSNVVASGGQYYQDSSVVDATVWFPFTGDSVTWEGIAITSGSRENRVYVDGVLLGNLNQLGNGTTQRDFSFDGFGAGIHVLRLERSRGELLVDGFTTPGSAPFYSTPVITGFVRYEENDPALSYNGYSWAQRPGSWKNDTAIFGTGSNG